MIDRRRRLIGNVLLPETRKSVTMLLLVIYNIKSDDRRSSLHNAITSVEHVALSDSVYVVAVSDTKQTAFASLSTHLTSEDDLIVSELDQQTVGWHRKPVADWMNLRTTRESLKRILKRRLQS